MDERLLSLRHLGVRACVRAGGHAGVHVLVPSTVWTRAVPSWCTIAGSATAASWRIGGANDMYLPRKCAVRVHLRVPVLVPVRACVRACVHGETSVVLAKRRVMASCATIGATGRYLVR